MRSHYSVKYEQGRYIRKGDIIIFEEPFLFFFTRKKEYLVTSSNFDRDEGWDITFTVTDAKLQGLRTELTLDMMEYFKVRKLVGETKGRI